LSSAGNVVDVNHILFDIERRWIAVDPKGVIGEIEYEIGASLRNPYENPEIFASA
jgi:streptomycin 6-kinase